jgi:hypothetical protein
MTFPDHGRASRIVNIMRAAGAERRYGFAERKKL